MKLAFIINLYPPYIVGGNEMLAQEVIEELRSRGHTIHVITGRGHDLPRDGFTHGVIDLDLDRKEEIFLSGKEPTPADVLKWHLYNHRTYRAVRSALLELKPDLIVVWNLFMASMAPLIAAQQTDRPLVIHTADKWLLYGLRDVGPLVWPNRKWREPVVRLARRTVQPVLFRLAKPGPIITISEFMRQVYIKAGFDPKQIEAIHLGVPLKMFHPDGRAEPSSSKVNFLYIGSLWEGKGPQVVIQALGRLTGKPGMPDLHVDFYGKGNSGFQDYLKGVVEMAGVERQVAFRGFIDRKDLPAIQRSHDILLFPSIWDEPFAAVPIEAMACGMAVIATTAGGTPEAIEDGRTGLLIPPNDVEAMTAAMMRLIEYPQLRWQLGQAAARTVREKWSFQSYADRLEGRYRTLARKEAK